MILSNLLLKSSPDISKVDQSSLEIRFFTKSFIRRIDFSWKFYWNIKTMGKYL